MVVELNWKQDTEAASRCAELVGLGRSTVYAKLARGHISRCQCVSGLEQWGGGQGTYLAWLEDPEREWDPSQA